MGEGRITVFERALESWMAISASIVRCRSLCSASFGLYERTSVGDR